MQKIIIAAYVLTTSAALVILKLGSNSSSPISIVDSRVHVNLNYYTVIGVFLYGISFLTYIYLISKFDLGYIIPLVTAFVYILIFTASYFIFKESFTAVKIAGISLIVMGIILLSLNK